MEPRVFVVEPNLSRRVHLELRLMEEGYVVQTFDSAAEFVTAYPDGASECCMVVNAELPDMCGVALLEWLRGVGCSAQGVVICPPSADVDLAVRGMRAGAVDFIDDEDPQARIVERLTEILKCQCKHRSLHHPNAPDAELTAKTKPNPPATANTTSSPDSADPSTTPPTTMVSRQHSSRFTPR